MHLEKLFLISQRECLHLAESPAFQNYSTQSNIYHISIRNTKMLFLLVNSWVTMPQLVLVLGSIQQKDCKYYMLLVQETILSGQLFYKLHQIVHGLGNFCADLFLYRQSICFHPYDSNNKTIQFRDQKIWDAESVAWTRS